MVKLTLKQIDSLIENDLLDEKQLNEFFKEEYTSADLKNYFLDKIKENKEYSNEDSKDDGNAEERFDF